MNRVIIKTFYSLIDVQEFLEPFYDDYEAGKFESYKVQTDKLSSGAIRVAIMIFDPEYSLEKSIG